MSEQRSEQCNYLSIRGASVDSHQLYTRSKQSCFKVEVEDGQMDRWDFGAKKSESYGEMMEKLEVVCAGVLEGWTQRVWESMIGFRPSHGRDQQKSRPGRTAEDLNTVSISMTSMV